MKKKEDYLKTLKDRKEKGKGRVNHSHQFIGLSIAKMLDDDNHKSLYIKLAKNNDEQDLMKVAKDVADRKNINNKGAYFMKVWKEYSNKK